MTACEVSGCERKFYAKGHCRLHYDRARRGQPLEAPPRYIPGRICSHPGCGKPYSSKGLCETHYRLQLYKGKPCRYEGCDNPAGWGGKCKFHVVQENIATYAAIGGSRRPNCSPEARDVNGHKECSTCVEWLPEENFYTNTRHADGLEYFCKRCQKLERVEKNYKLSAADIDEMFEKQSGTCGICPKSLGDTWVVDHDHKCCNIKGQKTCGDCVRGLLCSQCNIRLGHLENKTFTIAAERYLSGVSA